MRKKFGANNPSTIGVCTFLPCGGSRCFCIPHLPNVEMGNKGGRKRGRSEGTTIKYPQQHNNPHQQHQHQHQQQHQQQNQQQHHHHHHQHQNHKIINK